MDPQQQQPDPVPNQPPAPSPFVPASAPENPQSMQQPEMPQQDPQPSVQQNGEQLHNQDKHPSMEPISWEASESVHHEKDAIWFVGVLIVTALLSVLSIFVIKSWSFSILIVVMAAALIVFAKRPPRVMQYQMTQQGIDVNGRHHSFHEFRGFGVIQDGSFHYVSLLPIKSFMPAMDVYFPEEYGESIVDMLGSQMPMQTIKPDLLDAVTRQLRF